MGYSAGNLELSILGFSEKAVASIDVTAKALRRLASSIDKINNTQFVLAGQKMEVLFTKIAQATNSIDTKNIANLASAAKSLSSISRLSNLDKMDFDKVGKGFENLSVSIEPFLKKIKSAEASLTSLYGVLSKTNGKKIQGLLGDNTNSNKSSGALSFLNIGKWTAILYASKRLGSHMAKVVQYGADYTETLNLWETSMGNNLTVATEFVNKMNEAYGISEKTLMNAQAIFKNMLGSLGQISDSMAYSLSEGITQMALDYASLYNVTFEQAFTKFQAALAGQVRPIRSVAGYDITENTLFQLYQSLGGEKTMRQLSRTEKQLLAIYAVFKQMDASGAIGDLDKTMESFANQSRVMAEGWQRTMTYSGVILTHLIEQSGLMTYLNAVLIFLGDTLKAVAESMGAIKSFADPFESTTEGALDASDAIDEIKGKLLDFDKFRSLSGQSENALGLDEKLLEALSNFDSILEGSSMEAKKLADQFKIMSGLFDENGAFNLDRWNELLVGTRILLMEIAVLMGIVFGTKAISAIQTFAINFNKNFQEMRLQSALADTTLQKLQMSFSTLVGGVIALTTGITSLVMAWDNMTGLERFLTIFISLAAAIGAAAAAFYAFKQNWFMAVGVGALVAGTGLTIGSQLSSITDYKDGGLPDKGTVFRAGEAGAEIVYNTPSGQSGVANVQQIKAAHSQALKEWWATAKHDIPAFQGVSDSGLYTIVDGEAKRRGKRFQNV